MRLWCWHKWRIKFISHASCITHYLCDRCGKAKVKQW